jgi:hypothetical protein
LEKFIGKKRMTPAIPNTAAATNKIFVVADDMEACHLTRSFCQGNEMRSNFLLLHYAITMP